MERIANPVSGRVDEEAPRETTTRMLLCRYALAIVIPVFITVSVVGRDQPGWWWPLPFVMLVVLPLSAGANGSWWGMPSWSAWHTGMLVQSMVLLLALSATVVWGESLVLVIVAAVSVGVVLGVAAAQVWRTLQPRP
ncbi:hypothetical protein [Agrococcus jenensis]|uniref:Uncharacterized protein n=1 Tax=Agrococcus jenensis TaxID=46353 RepID=A0A3N2AU08_9MICO|nr:hypothetical protein [Agrococcus jenensis]ROR66521.1 hypothetical protein EDD26_1905 [Agrococcus jenensis]